ncbi:MAG: exosortase family protein XrtG [Lachnospiraceae bacterium]|nr:exosortase family protein XrtG [Lachnospiraceae bacterium]
MVTDIIMILLFFVWLYVVWTCSRAGLKFYKFIIGCVGLFLFMMYWLRPVVLVPMEQVVALVSGSFGNLTGTFESYYEYAMLFVRHAEESISVYVSFECSGIIESFAFVSMLIFFEVYDAYERIILSLLGVLIIFFSNVLRIVVICLLINWFGNDIYYIAHSLIGRFLFYGLSIALYFYVFTKPQIIRQSIGGFSYRKQK